MTAREDLVGYRFGLLVGAVLVGLVGAGSAGCEYRSRSAAEKALQEKPQAQAPDQVSHGVRFFVYNEDQPRAEIRAARMERYEEEDSTYTLLRGPTNPQASDSAKGRVDVQVFDRKGDSTATITANQITYHDDKRRFEARGRVVVNTAEGKRLEGEHLTWLEDERRVRTPGFIRIITPTDRVQGYGFEANEDLSNYQLKDVTGETTIETPDA